MKSNPENLVRTAKYGLDRVQNENYAYLVYKSVKVFKSFILNFRLLLKA